MLAINRNASVPLGRRGAIGAPALVPSSAINNQAVNNPPVAPREWQEGSKAGVARLLNEQVGALQLAGAYLQRLADCLHSCMAGDAHGLRALDDLLDARPRMAGGFLDARFTLDLHRAPRSELRIAGLTSLHDIAQAGSETLLFSASRHPSGPLAVVLDTGLDELALLARLNAGLGPFGLRAHREGDAALVFSGREADWLRLKGRLRVQGEGRLFDSGGFMALSVEERGLFDTAGKADLPGGIRHVAALRRSIAEQLAGLEAQLGSDWNREEQRRIHDFSATLPGLATRYASYARFITGQANLGRSATLGLLG